MSKAYIGIGSNLGDRQRNCLDAIERLQTNGLLVTKRSSMHETEPWGVKQQPKFINMAVEVKTDIPPQQLLGLLKKIETDMGRMDTVKWGPRVIDLDILLYDNIKIDEDVLKIPHPMMHERDFVLGPLSEIAPDKEHPGLSVTIKKLLENITA
ncbi:MAG: 2-amino-4-hydroxy-6-hydroxymethyldihydropteridine diphosphokinase [Nitrospirota bacterium]|nr:2-amino-4-hydroxy-6-hydroxymethyldihydropteridine diphosphokinase [Nitrospirota bacterium]